LSYLYFIQDEESKDIKIGRTKDINRRIKEIRRGSNRSYQVLYAFNNLAHLEIELHQYLFKYRIRYEWFREDCLDLALSFLESYGINEKGLSQTWGKVCDFDRWLKSSDLNLYQNISDFIFISLCFGYKWTKESIESTFRITKRDALSLICEIELRNKTHILSRFIELLIDEKKLEPGVFSFSSFDEIKIVTGFVVYVQSPLKMHENIRKELNGLKIELASLTREKTCSSYQVSLF